MFVKILPEAKSKRAGTSRGRLDEPSSFVWSSRSSVSAVFAPALEALFLANDASYSHAPCEQSGIKRGLRWPELRGAFPRGFPGLPPRKERHTRLSLQRGKTLNTACSLFPALSAPSARTTLTSVCRVSRG